MTTTTSYETETEQSWRQQEIMNFVENQSLISVIESDYFWEPSLAETRFEVELDKARIDAFTMRDEESKDMTPAATWRIACKAAKAVGMCIPDPISSEHNYVRGAAVYLWQELEGLSPEDEKAGDALKISIDDAAEPKNFTEHMAYDFIQFMRSTQEKDADGELLDGVSGIPIDGEVLLITAMIGLLSTVYIAGREDQIQDMFGTNQPRTVRAREIGKMIRNSDMWLSIYDQAFSDDDKHLLKQRYEQLRGTLGPKTGSVLRTDAATIRGVAYETATDLFNSPETRKRSLKYALEKAAEEGIYAFLVHNGLATLNESVVTGEEVE